MRNAYINLVSKTEWTRPLGRPRRRWVENVKRNLKQTERQRVDWIHLAQERDHWRALANTAMNLRFP
jgi:hypothetical protein